MASDLGANSRSALSAKFGGRRPSHWRLTEFRLYAFVLALSLGSSLGTVLAGRVPIANGADEFSYLLGGQTFAAGRLTNPTHPHWQFFESFHVLSRPTYMAKYPPAQSLCLALGEKLGHPIFGVWLSSAAFAAAGVYFLRARFGRGWAVFGGVLIVAQFGFTHYYSQSYWGGSIGATAGALILGATLRLVRWPSTAAAGALGLGIALGAISRPFETLLLCLVPGFLLLKAFIARRATRARYLRQYCTATVPLIAAALLFQGILNRAVTGQWSRLPYVAYEEQYSRVPFLVWQEKRPPPEFHHQVFAIFHQYFVVPTTRFDSPVPQVWLKRVVGVGVGSIGPVLAVVALLGSLWYPTRTALRLLAAFMVNSIGLVLSYWYVSHYYAGIHVLCVFLAVHALRAVYLTRPDRRWFFPILVVPILAASLLFRVKSDAHLRPFVGRLAYVRRDIQDQFSSDGEKHLIFVRRILPFNFHFIWVHNDADIDAGPLVWAHDRGNEENQKLIGYYQGRRRAWLLVEGDDNPQLLPYGVVGEP